MVSNIDVKTVNGFGDEWTRFDQSALPHDELLAMFDLYFKVFPWDSLPEAAVGFDLGCGSGRWARCVAPRVGRLHCIDASEAAVRVARRNLRHTANCEFHVASVDAIPLPDSSMDFGYSLGVLHHVPNTEHAIQSCVSKLKPRAPFLLYLYYALENQPVWFRALWKASDAMRRAISGLPSGVKFWVTSGIALAVYFPLARLTPVFAALGFNVESIPLSAYRKRSFYTMCTDAFDRFGTRLEQRFTAAQISGMMQRAGLEEVVISPSPPYWCAVGVKQTD
jgi:SAM-dependent methyltransferase